MRRLCAGLVLVVVIGTGCGSEHGSLPACGRPEDSVFALIAQSVPSAAQLPCLQELPVGWILSGMQIQDGRTQLWLDSTIAGVHAVEVDLQATCDTSDAVEVPPAPDETGMTPYVRSDLPPSFAGIRYLVFDGGCVIYRYHFTGEAPPTLALEAEAALSFLPRHEVVQRVADEYDQILCGATAPPCEG